jgi:hypothetical protein
MEKKVSKREIVSDGDGYGVREFSRHYGEYEFLNDEPFPSASAARAWLRRYDAGKSTDWEALRRQWARGLIEDTDT